MIGKPEWFARRKYSGWGLFPKTWQGWLYTVVLVALTMAIVYIPFSDMKVRIGVLVVWGIILLVEVGSIMIKIRDEREKMHEAIAERNALWAVILVLVVGVGYQVASSSVKNDFSVVDPFLIAAVVAALVVKAVSNIWLDRRN
ncbi:MAG: hypothetical protein AABW63_01530 [Nanoarchaeota archaeon]